MGFLRLQGCGRQIISAPTVLSDVHVLQVFMHKSMKFVVGFRRQRHDAGFSKTIQNKTTITTKNPPTILFC